MMKNILILLCVFTFFASGCASKQGSTSSATPSERKTDAKASQPAAQTAPEGATSPATPPQKTIAAPKAEMTFPKQDATATAPATPTGGFPMSPADAVKLIEPKQAMHIGGGWGREIGEAVVFKRGDTYYNYIMLEHFLIIARNRMFVSMEKGDDYVVLNDRLKFIRSVVDDNKKKYDRWVYTFIISKKTDIDRARKIVESSMKSEEKTKRLQEFTETFSQEFWFDVTAVFGQQSDDLFKGFGKKGT